MANELSLDPKINKEVKAVVKYANDVAIMTADDMVQASEKVKVLSSLKKQIEDQRTEFTKPLNESLKRINAWFKQFTQPLDEADKIIREKLVACKNTLPEDQNQFGEVHFTTSTIITVEDITKVPYEYLMVDEAKVKKALLAGVTNISGISVRKEKKVSL